MSRNILPTIALTYGPPGCGKTTAGVGAGAGGVIFAQPAALECQSFFDIDVSKRMVPAKGGVRGATAFVKKYGDKVSILTVDDMQFIIEEEVAFIQRSLSGYQVWDVVAKRVMEFADACNSVKAYTHVIHHEKPPRLGGKKDEKGNAVEGQTFQIKGVPAVPGWQLPDQYPGIASIVARVVYDEGLGGSWPYVYDVAPNPMYVTKDRTDKLVTTGRFPLNMAEALRFTGRTIERPKGFEWMEAMVEETAAALVATDDAETVLEEMAKKAMAHKDCKTWRHARWVLWDAHARAHLRRANSASEGLSSFVTRLASGGSSL